MCYVCRFTVIVRLLLLFVSLSLSLCLLVTAMRSLTKTAEPIEVQFWMWTLGGQKNRVSGVAGSPMGRDTFKGDT